MSNPIILSWQARSAELEIRQWIAVNKAGAWAILRYYNRFENKWVINHNEIS